MKDFKSPFLDHMGAVLISASEGEAQVELQVKPHHLQHMGLVHGGVISTLMDNTGWYAAISNVYEGYTVMTMEIKINYLKPTAGRHLIASAKVKRQGKTTTFVTIELEDEESLAAYATGTYAILKES